MKEKQPSVPDAERQDEVLLPIGEVSVITGVNAVTLRAWQRRFGLVIPARTPKGHRLYTPENIQEIHEINAWLAKGVAISKVKPLLLSAAKSLPLEATQTEVTDIWAEQIAALTVALLVFNQHKLHQILDEAIGLYPFQLVKDKLLQPWLNHLDSLLVERLDAELVTAWLKCELLSRIGGRFAFTNQAYIARIAVVSLSRTMQASNSTRTNILFSLILLLELAASRVSVIDLDEQAIGSLPLLSDRLKVDALLLIPDSNHSGSEQAEILSIVEHMAFPCFLIGPFAPTLISLSAFAAASVSDLICSVSPKSTSMRRQAVSVQQAVKVAANVKNMTGDNSDIT
jgi:DNA-binding transcriptional MerR regulator